MPPAPLPTPSALLPHTPCPSPPSHLPLSPTNPPLLLTAFPTFPEDVIPLMTARQTMIQATSRDRVILTFRPPLSAMVLIVFRVWRYQNVRTMLTGG
uniref:formin-like protein 9 n=1 Tax=Oncorhynchus gorbuscha TaxID=8017 RepID=UPI001EAF0B6D|nr:formin-like protein 9 [Oncorhynchus gorbuscha]